jgi:hypothetical protein
MPHTIESNNSIADKSAAIHRAAQKISCKLLKFLVPGVGVEPTRPYGQRILRALRRVSLSLTKRYEPVFTRLAVVKVLLRLATYQHVRPPSWPHLRVSKKTKTDVLHGLIARMTPYERSSNNV